MTELTLRPQDRQQLMQIISKHLPGVEAWAYGSRANGQAHSGSDLDIVLRGKQLKPISASHLAAIKEALSQSSIPILVDIRDWATIPESFRREIRRNHIALR